MACATVDEVRQLAEFVADPSVPLDRTSLDGLGIDLPCLRRPRGQRGAWDVARYRAMPPALRAASGFFVMRAEIANGGEDQLVWNQIAILPAMLGGLVHVGADQAAAFLSELAVELLESETDPDQDAVRGFLAFRGKVGDRGWNGGVDVVDDVAEALVAHALAHSADFVVEPVERLEWSDGRNDFRATILRFPDGCHEVQVDERVGHQRLEWAELPRDAERPATLEEARAIARCERDARSTSPTHLTYTVSSCSRDSAGRYRLYPAFPVDRLPVGARLRLRIRIPDDDPSDAAGTSIETGGVVQLDTFPSPSIRVLADADAAIPSPVGNQHARPFWGSGWEVECEVQE